MFVADDQLISVSNCLLFTRVIYNINIGPRPDLQFQMWPWLGLKKIKSCATIILSNEFQIAAAEWQYRKNLNIIRMILTKSKGPVEGLRIIQVN